MRNVQTQTQIIKEFGTCLDNIFQQRGTCTLKRLNTLRTYLILYDEKYMYLKQN